MGNINTPTFQKRLDRQVNGVRRQVVDVQWSNSYCDLYEFTPELLAALRESGASGADDEIVASLVDFPVEFQMADEKTGSRIYKKVKTPEEVEAFARDAERTRLYREGRAAMPCVVCGDKSTRECNYTGILCCGNRLCDKCKCPIYSHRW